MKTPDENKCGMECIRTNAERTCVKPENGQCPRCEQLVEETLGRVRQLESTYSQVSKALCGKENASLDELLQAADQLKTALAQAERERDALMLYIPRNCISCKHEEKRYECTIPCKWEWRGVCPENTKEP